MRADKKRAAESLQPFYINIFSLFVIAQGKFRTTVLLTSGS